MTKNLPLVLMIEDDPYFQKIWKDNLGSEVNFKAFSSPFQFEEAVDAEDTLLAAVCIIVDFDFGSENAGELDIVDFIKAKGYLGKIFLCSVHANFGEYDAKIRKDFDQILKKTPLNWENLSKVIKEGK